VSEGPSFSAPITNVTVPVGREAILSCVVANLSTYKPAEFAEIKNGKSLWTDKQITTGIARGLHCRECIPRHAAETWTCTNGFRGVTNIVHCDILPEFHSYFELLGVAAYNLSPQLSDVSSRSRSGHLHVSPTTAVT
ncbi:hypothetical protein ALC62_09489, partial [Cyphomyrmex costatus]